MKIHTCDSLKLPASIIAIGAFDGVHRGHQELILSARRQAEDLKVPLVIYTFDPPPKVYFQKVQLLTPLPEKLDKFSRLGVQHVVVAPFGSQYASRNAEYFFDELRELNPKGIWVGSDFRFGANRNGNVDLLSEQFSVHMLEPVRCISGEIISSSRIRQLFNEANKLLGWNTDSMNESS